MNKNYELLFKKDELEGEKWSNAYYSYIYSIIEGYEKEFDNTFESYSNEDLIFTIICNLCYPYLSNFSKQYEISKFKYSDIIKDYDIDINDKNSWMKILTDNHLIKVIKLSGNFKGFSYKKIRKLKMLNNINDIYRQLIDISKKLTKDNKIVTGYIYEESTKNKKIYSWIEFKNQNEEYIIDFMNNFIMNKEGYYYLKHVEKINEISSKIIKDDEKFFGKFNQILNLKEQEYLTFRDLIIRDLEKNKQLIIN